MQRDYLKNELKRKHQVQCLSSFVLLLILISIIIHFIQSDYKIHTSFKFTFISMLPLCINIISIVFCLLVIFKTYKIAFLGFLGLFYSIMLFFIDNLLIPDDSCVLLYFLFIVTLYSRGYLSKYAKSKYFFLLMFFFGLMLTDLRFGYNFFLQRFFKQSFLVILFLVLFYIFENKIKDMNELRKAKNIFNLLLYPELTEKDRKILKVIIKTDMKYENLAPSFQMKEKSVRTRLSKLFKIIGEGDRISLMAKYADSVIITCEKDLKEYEKEIKKMIEEDTPKE